MTKAARFRKKPVVVEAILWDGHNLEAVKEFMAPDVPDQRVAWGSQTLGIWTANGMVRTEAPEWIIKGTKGEFYPCSVETFKEIYERA